MNKIIKLGKLLVANKSEDTRQNSLGVSNTYYNIVVIDEKKQEGDVISVNKSIYDSLEVKKTYEFSYFERTVKADDKEWIFKEWLIG